MTSAAENLSLPAEGEDRSGIGYLKETSTSYFGCIPHPVIVTIMDNQDYIRVLTYSYCSTITGWGSS